MQQFNRYNSVEPASAPYASATLSSSAPITVRDLVGILRRRALLSSVTFLVTLGAAYFITSKMVPTYEATTKVLLDNSPAAAMPSSVLELLNGKTAASSDVEIAKIKSRAFLSEVIRKTKIGPAITPEELRDRLNITVSGGDQVMEITAKMKRDPAMTANVANTVARVYKEYVVKEGDDKIKVASSRLETAAKKAGIEKDLAERDLERFMTKLGVSDPNAFFNSQSTKTVGIRNALQDALRDLPLKKQDIKLYAAIMDSESPTMKSGTSLDRNSLINFYQDQMLQLNNERRVKLDDFGPQSPEILEIDSKIQAAQKSLQEAKAIGYRQGSYSVGVNPDYAAAKSKYLAAKTALEQSESQIAAFQKQLNTLQIEQSTIAPLRVKFQELQRRVDVTTEYYSKAKSALLQIPLNRITNVENISILEEARIPGGPISPKPLLNTMLAVFSGLFLGVIVAILAEYLTSAPKSDSMDREPLLPGLPAAPVFAESLPTIAGVPLLARVALSGGRTLSSHSGNGLPSTSGNATTEDAFREIGYLLSHPSEDGSGRVPVVLMAGTRTDETTASVAAYLTATLVRDGVRVTLVDGDRVEPRLHEVFGKPDAPGVTDILSGRITAGEALHTGAGGNLRFLAAGGKSDPTPLTEETLRKLYDELGRATDTDLVLISGPSVWSARLVSPMERAADGIVLVASDAQVAPEESVARARRILTNGYKPRLLGVIVGEETSKDPSALAAKSETNS